MGIGKEFMTLMDDIGYRFNDMSLLETALTHTSYSNELKRRGFNAKSNESLEFLGDAVLEIVVSEELFTRCADKGEGVLTQMRQALVCETTLAKVAQNISLGEYLNIGSGEESTDLRSRSKVLADSFEAVVAAIYLDDSKSGYHKYRQVIIGLLSSEFDSVLAGKSMDYKSMLQQFVEKNDGSVLHYEYIEDGPSHSKSFVAVAYINNNKVGTGSGTTKRAAEANAAMHALRLFGIVK